MIEVIETAEGVEILETREVTVIEVGIAGPQGPPGTLIEAAEDGTVVSSPLRQLDFRSGFDLLETAPRFVQVSLDLEEFTPYTDDRLNLNNRIDGHLDDAINAHEASAVHFNPTGDIAETNVQDAIVEVATQAAAAIAAGHPNLAAHDALGLATQDELDAEAAARAAADTAHVDASDPHAQYLTPAEGNAVYDALGAASSAVASHEADTTNVHGITDTSLLADQAYVASAIATAISDLIDAAPGALDTLNELAAALGDDPNFATTITNALALKLNISAHTLVLHTGLGLETTTGAQSKADAAEAASETYADNTKVAKDHVWHDVTDHGADATGSADSRSAIATADGLGGADFPKGTYRVASNLTITNTMRFAPGAVIKPDSGVIVTIAGGIEAGVRQIFDVSAGGVFARVATSFVRTVWIEWFGAKGDDTTMCDDPIEAAFDLAKGAGTGGNWATGGQTLIMAGIGRFKTADPHSTPAFCGFRGIAVGVTIFHATTADAQIAIGDVSYASRGTISGDFTFDADDLATTAILISRADKIVVRNITVENPATDGAGGGEAFRWEYTQNSDFYSLQTNNFGGWAYTFDRGVGNIRVHGAHLNAGPHGGGDALGFFRFEQSDVSNPVGFAGPTRIFLDGMQTEGTAEQPILINCAKQVHFGQSHLRTSPVGVDGSFVTIRDGSANPSSVNDDLFFEDCDFEVGGGGTWKLIDGQPGTGGFDVHFAGRNLGLTSFDPAFYIDDHINVDVGANTILPENLFENAPGGTTTVDDRIKTQLTTSVRFQRDTVDEEAWSVRVRDDDDPRAYVTADGRVVGLRDVANGDPFGDLGPFLDDGSTLWFYEHDGTVRGIPLGDTTTAPTLTHKTGGANGSSGTTATTASVTLDAGAVVLVGVETVFTGNDADDHPPVLTATGLDWTTLGAQKSNSNAHLTTLLAAKVGSGGFTGTITITVDATADAIAWVVEQSSPGSFIRNVAKGNAVNSNSVAATYPYGFADAVNDVAFAIVGSNGAATVTQRSSPAWTELADRALTAVTGRIEAQYLLGEDSGASATAAGGATPDMQIVAVELGALAPAVATHTHASSAITVQEDDATVDAAVTTLDFGHGLDVTSSPAGEANVAVDEGELAHGSLAGLTSGDPHTQYLLERGSGGAATDVPAHTHGGTTEAGGTLAPSTFTLPTTTSPAQTTEGRMVWDSDDDVLTVGDGASRKTFGKLGSTTGSAVGTAAAGSSVEGSRVDHVHPTGAGSPSTQAFGDAAATGSGPAAAMSDHKHAMPSERSAASTTPAAVGTAAVGVGTTDARADHVHATGAGTPTTSAVADAAATGSGPAAAMTDHVHGRESFGSSAAAVGTSAAGSAATPSRSDHVHATGAGTPSTQAFGDAAATGTGPAAAMTDHKHAMPSERSAASTTPAAVGTAAVGVGTTDARSDHVHAASGDTPSTQAFGDAAAAGSSAKAAQSDHKHAMPSERSAASTTPAAVGTAAVGTGTTDARSDHVHATGAGTPSTQAIGDAASTGSGPAAAMTDHKHAMPSFATPAVALGSSAGAGSAATLLRSDATIAAFDATSPTTQALADAAAVGSAAFSARRDHKHAMFSASDVITALQGAAGGLPYVVVATSVDGSITGDNTLNNDAALFTSGSKILANAVYWFELYAVFTAANSGGVASTADLKVNFTFPTSPTVVNWGVLNNAGQNVGGWGPPSTGVSPLAISTAATSSMSIGGAALSWGVAFGGMIVNGANAGDIQFQWSQDFSNAATLQRDRGFLRLWRLS